MNRTSFVNRLGEPLVRRKGRARQAKERWVLRVGGFCHRGKAGESVKCFQKQGCESTRLSFTVWGHRSQGLVSSRKMMLTLVCCLANAFAAGLQGF